MKILKFRKLRNICGIFQFMEFKKIHVILPQHSRHYFVKLTSNNEKVFKMERNIRKYTNEFKQESVNLALKSPSISKTARAECVRGNWTMVQFPLTHSDLSD